MSFMKGDLLTKTRKLVKGLAKAEPVWYKAMEQAPPPTFPRADAIQRIALPEDVYIKSFLRSIQIPNMKMQSSFLLLILLQPVYLVVGCLS
ncbi:hypothetical protein RchiOBHm_Chr7g0220351 [Rosa chinensis]|uniref:Small ribosomal subunit protein mS23 n=1 Tax=Rosa chinensis TaxID=74649 RepID=A0A2P6PCT6_ROSCH|nr:hypothetical protein RchiOBHm_Chr7g0220351 [Rosa chinensis]